MVEKLLTYFMKSQQFSYRYGERLVITASIINKRRAMFWTPFERRLEELSYPFVSLYIHHIRASFEIVPDLSVRIARSLGLMSYAAA
jgi:hypothetical protein